MLLKGFGSADCIRSNYLIKIVIKYLLLFWICWPGSNKEAHSFILLFLIFDENLKNGFE